MAHVLVAEDQRNVRTLLALELRDGGHQVVEAGSGREAMELLGKGVFDLVITDLLLGEVDGIQVLKEAKRVSPSTEVVVVTAHGTVESGVAAMKLGAFDYITKPVKPEEMALVVAQALEKRQLGDRVQRLEARQQEEFHGASPAWLRVVDAARKVAETESTVLLTGESGSGKEVVAELIHRFSRRRDKPLLKINLGAITETLQESELFGHVRGAFTGAVASRKGIFMEADGSSLFLDEVGESAPSTQVALLRVLAQSEVRPVGGSRDVKVDVRVILATNADLAAMVREGRFREDLFFRINVFPIRVPSLRERAEDIPALAEFLLARHCARLNRAAPTLAEDARLLLSRYHWPGNVRELENVLERTLILYSGELVTAADVPLGPVDEPSAAPTVLRSLAEVEREHVLSVLARCEGRKQETADVLGIGRATLFRKLREYGVA